MDLRDRAVVLYGRFTPGVRDRLLAQIEAAGGVVARDLTLRSDLFVVGGLAAVLIDSGALATRLRAARARGVPILGERAFVRALAGESGPVAATLPVATALAGASLTRDDLDVLAAFDLIALSGEACRFADAGVIRTAAELVAQGRSLADVVGILRQARDLSPSGLHRIVLNAAGEAVLQWQDGVTSLEGQGFLPLSEEHASVEALFEAAAIAEANGEAAEAVRLYDLCARADRRDAIAPYNAANILLAAGDPAQAALGYQRALGRDPRFVEARYNLANAYEAMGRTESAAAELERVLAEDPAHADALFNLAQLRLKAGAMDAAKALFERYLDLDPPEAWAATARKAILYCSGRLSA